MKTKRFLSLVLLSAIVVSCLVVSTEATEYQGRALTYVVDATGSFDTDVPANTTVKAKRSFPLEVGEVVTIKATYSPFSASVDFGLIAPDSYRIKIVQETGEGQKRYLFCEFRRTSKRE